MKLNNICLESFIACSVIIFVFLKDFLSISKMLLEKKLLLSNSIKRVYRSFLFVFEKKTRMETDQVVLRRKSLKTFQSFFKRQGPVAVWEVGKGVLSGVDIFLEKKITATPLLSSIRAGIACSEL